MASTKELRSEQEASRINAIRAGRGSMAHIPVSVEDLHRERQKEREKEEARIRELHL